MCDTMFASSDMTAHGAGLFGKNSDRERNEAQGLELLPARRHEAGSALRLTYIEIPQVSRTHACLISRPFWMWGAEMGANHRGVVIGNEAVHALVPASKTPALIGMDLVRLGLERGDDAASAVEIMIALLERHGQGGNCGYLEPFYYHNSFMVADASEAYVLETVGSWWALERVQGVRAISNVLSIEAGERTVSPAFQAHAAAKGWLDKTGRFSVADRLMDPDKDATTRGRERCARSTDLLAARGDRIAVADIMIVLRDHGHAAEHRPDWTPAEIEGRTLCMHAGHDDRRSQTVASMVSDLRPSGAVHWVTGSSAPCLGIFKPVTIGSGLPDQGPSPTRVSGDGSRWWRSEAIHRAALADYPDRLASLASERDQLEQAFRERIDMAIQRGVGAELRAEVEACWREADNLEARWAAGFGQTSPRPDDAYLESWMALSRAASPEALAQTR